MEKTQKTVVVTIGIILLGVFVVGQAFKVVYGEGFEAGFNEGIASCPGDPVAVVRNADGSFNCLYDFKPMNNRPLKRFNNQRKELT